MAKKSVAKGNTRQPGNVSKSIDKSRSTSGDTGNVAQGGGSGNTMKSGTPGGSSNAMKSGTP